MPVLRDALAQRGLTRARIGVDYNSYCMPVARFARIQAALPGAEFTNLYLEEPAEFWQMRLGFPGPPCYFVFNRQGQWTKFEAQDNVAVDYGAMETFIVERLRDK